MATVSAVAAGSLVQTAQSTFDASSNSNMAVYWGQGPSQPRLAHFCEDTNIDIIPIAFLNVFPDQVNGGYPGTNFGNQCGSETFKNKDGSSSPLLSNCPFIGPDIKTCQALGKKILLSLGGAIPTNQSIKNDESAVAFAKFVWNAFGPVDATYDGPRPFGDAVVDGFDFDIESAISDNDATSQYRGYGKMIDTLRIFFAADAQKQYYISGSPQCVIPDAHLAHPIQSSWFDFLFIQFYNTPHCSARAYFDATYGAQDGQPSAISFDAWVGFVRTMAMNKDVKLYIGLPAAPLTQLAYDTKMYIAPDDVVNLIDVFQCRYPQEFGGIMVFEATYSEQNLIDGNPFVDVIKGQLTKCDCAKKPVTSSVTSSTTTGHVFSNLILYHQGLRFRILAIVYRSWYLEFDKLHGSCGYRIFVNPSIFKQHRHLEHDKDHSPRWNWILINPSVPDKHWYLEYDKLHSPYWNWILINTSVPNKHWYLEYDNLHGSYPLSSGTGYTSSAISVNSSTSPSSSLSSSSSSSSSSSFSLYPTGASSSTTATSVPYPVTNSTTSSTTTASGGVIYTTETITVTNCPPEVTSCPVRTSVTTYPVTTSSSIPITSVPTDSLETTASVSSTPVTSPLKSHGGITTVIVTSYITTCPVTGTTTIHGSTSVYTTSTVSTVHTTITSIIPVSPVPSSGASPTGHGQQPPSVPVPVHAGSSNTASPPSAPGNNPINSGLHPAPQSEQPAHGGSSSSSGNGNSPISHPVPQPEQPAHGGSSSSGNGNSPISYPAPQPEQSTHGGSSSTSGNGNGPVSHPVTQPEQPTHGGSSSSSGNGNSPISQPVHQPEQPAHGGASSSSGNGNNPISHPAPQPEQPSQGGSSSPAHGGSSSPSSNNGSSPSQPQQPAAPAHGPSSSNGNSPVQAGNNSPQGPAAPGLSTTLQTSTKAITATLQTAGSSSPASAAPANSQTTTSLPAVITQTLVPIPVSPEQTAHPAGPGVSSTGSLSPVQASPVPSPVGSGIGSGSGSSAPFPAGNGTAPSGPSGSASVGPSASAPGLPETSVTPFTGGASKIGSSVFAMAVVMAAAAMI
ncbi:MAG: hypothetical protein Q9181_005346 [Wetmoreana brouardii]